MHDEKRTFAPDKWPPQEPEANEYRRVGEGYAIVPKGSPASPFTPEQEARLRRIAWEAAEANWKAQRELSSGSIAEGKRIANAFLQGRAKP